MTTRLVVEHSFDPPLKEEQLNKDSKRLDDCLQLHGASWVRSYVSADGRRMICEFEGPDAEAVRESYRSAGVDFERVWVAEVYARS